MGFGTWVDDDGNGPGKTVNCRCVVVLPRRAFFQACADAMPVEVEVLKHTPEGLVIVEAVQTFPFVIFSRWGVVPCNLAPVLAEHVRLLEVRR